MGDQVETRPRADSAEVAFRKIFIGGLSYSTDEEKLKKYFKQYGNVQDAVVMKDPVSKRSRGFGFITFVDISSVDTALANEPHTIDSRKVEAKRAVPRSEISREPGSGGNQKGPHSSPQKPNASAGGAPAGGKPAASNIAPVNSTQSAQAPQQDSNKQAGNEGRGGLEEYAYNKIFVGGLHYDTRDAEFRAYFEKYGRVISAEVMFNRETHKSRGFGFIVFEVENSAVKVCNVKEHSIDGKVVEVKRAIPRSRLPAGTPTASINAGTYKTPAPSPANSAPAPAAAASSAPAPKPSGGSAGATGPSTATSNKPATGSSGRKAYSAVAGGEHNATSAAASAPAASGSTSSTATTASSRTVTSTSYAAALKGASAQDSAQGSILGPSSSAPLRDHGAHHIGNSGMNLLLSVQRPNRSYSEPIVKFEGSSALNGDSIPLDSALLNRNANAGTISNASSRSNSIVQAPSGSLVLGNNVGYSPDSSHGKSPVTLSSLPAWLSSPPSNPLDPTGADFGMPMPLPPASEQHKQPGASSTDSHHSGNRSLSSNSFSGSNQGMLGSNGMWFPSPQMALGDPQQQAAFQQAAMQQQYMGGPFGGMMFNPYMPAPPGMPPSPEAWNAMVSGHPMHDQHHQNAALMGMPPGQFPGHPGQFMMPPFPFYAPDGSINYGPGPNATQQQMMFHHYQQQAMFQMQQQQAMFAQMQAMGANNGNPGAPGSNPLNGGDQQKNLSNSFNNGNLGFPGAIPGVSGGAPASGGKTSEQTESDDLFQFSELNMDSPAFDPSSNNPWAPASRR